MYRRFIPLLLLLAACSTPPAPDPPPLVLITAAPNASPTPTPFQPPLVGEAAPTSVYFFQVPTLEPVFPTATPSPTLLPSPTAEVSLFFPTIVAPTETSPETPAPLPPLGDKETVNFLLIGSDRRSGVSFRTDSMVIAILWPKEAQASLISIPRDLWVYIPTVGMQRINTAYEYGDLQGYEGGGAALLRDTIAYNLGIRIDHTAMVDFNGFRRIVDALGGIDVPVACPYTDWRLIDPSYDPYNENNWTLYTVSAGVIHMDGDLALWYARSRQKSNDFDRGRRQQEVLRALFAQALRTDTLGRIPQLYSDLSGAVVTDLGLADILRLAPYAPRLTNAAIRSYYIRPPHVVDWTTPGGAYVLLPQDSLASLLVEATSLSAFTVQRQQIVIEVQNGTPFDGWDALAASRLNYAGYSVNIRPTDRRDYGSSVLVDLTPSQDPNARSALLSLLGLTSASILPMPDANSPVRYRLILGYDYQPCFQPQELSH